MPQQTTQVLEEEPVAAGLTLPLVRLPEVAGVEEKESQ
jgi:hypothetical protein